MLDAGGIYLNILQNTFNVSLGIVELQIHDPQ